jgi:hypothetical protein
VHVARGAETSGRAQVERAAEQWLSQDVMHWRPEDEQASGFAPPGWLHTCWRPPTPTVPAAAVLRRVLGGAQNRFKAVFGVRAGQVSHIVAGEPRRAAPRRAAPLAALTARALVQRCARRWRQRGSRRSW